LDLLVALGEEGVDEQELDRATRLLRNQIADMDVDEVHIARGGELPAGAKGDPITIGGIVVALTSAGVFTGLVELLKSWVTRHEGRTVTLKAKVGDREVELTYSPTEVSSEELTHFVDTIVDSLNPGPTEDVTPAPTGG
jgi:hypothetical protein